MRELIVGKNDAGQRLDRFIAKALPRLPSSLLQKHLRRKDIKLGGRAAKGDARLKEGDVVSLYIADEFFVSAPAKDNAHLQSDAPAPDIVYEDGNILLVNKAPGLLCYGGAAPENTLIARVQSYLYNKGEWDPGTENSFAPALCNRIDRNTGGLVIAAKNAEALRIVNEKLRSREIDKYYLCAALGAVSPPKGVLEGYILKDAKTNQVTVLKTSAPGAKFAVTEYRTLETRDSVSLLECRLITGRTHQIRAQLAAAGHPLLGDRKYGGGAGRKSLALWSYKLAFAFKSDAGALNYLDGRSFELKKAGLLAELFKNID